MNKNTIGKLILIGIRYYNNNNELLEQYQTSGIHGTQFLPNTVSKC